jgi:ATP/ADP translocase
MCAVGKFGIFYREREKRREKRRKDDFNSGIKLISSSPYLLPSLF